MLRLFMRRRGPLNATNVMPSFPEKIVLMVIFNQHMEEKSHLNAAWLPAAYVEKILRKM